MAAREGRSAARRTKWPPEPKGPWLVGFIGILMSWFIHNPHITGDYKCHPPKKKTILNNSGFFFMAQLRYWDNWSNGWFLTSWSTNNSPHKWVGNVIPFLEPVDQKFLFHCSPFLPSVFLLCPFQICSTPAYTGKNTHRVGAPKGKESSPTRWAPEPTGL